MYAAVTCWACLCDGCQVGRLPGCPILRPDMHLSTGVGGAGTLQCSTAMPSAHPMLFYALPAPSAGGFLCAHRARAVPLCRRPRLSCTVSFPFRMRSLLPS